MCAELGNVHIARDYLKAIEQGATGEALARFFDPAVLQEEFPNRLLPQGARRTLPDLIEGAERGRKVISEQSFEVHNAIESGNQVALEVTWVGILKKPVQTLAAGARMRARFAVFLEFREGRIMAQRNYDCFDPW
jgi:ketosteroid isomerase-like protein